MQATSLAVTPHSWAMGVADARRRALGFSLAYYLGVSAGLYMAWVSCTAAGAFLGPRIGDLEQYGFDMAFTAAEIHRNGTVGIQRDPGLISQGQGAYLPRRTDVIGAQIIEPAHGLPARKYANHQQQARRNGGRQDQG